jgi:hypothetical protein
MIVVEGALVRYGEAERWKRIKKEIGRTKPSRAPAAIEKKRREAFKNDGRPPDTAAQLIRNAKVNKQSRKGFTEPNLMDLFKTSPTKRRAPAIVVGYPWEDNSCWLDTSLDLISHALNTDPTTATQFYMMCVPSPEDSALSGLAKVLGIRRSLMATPAMSPDVIRNMSASLKNSRNEFRQLLWEKGAMWWGIDKDQALWVSEYRLST